MRKMYKVFATGFALALVLASPQTAITSHAFGFNIDAPEHDYAGDSDFSLPDPDAGSSGSGSFESSSSSGSDSSGGGLSYDGGSSSDGGTSVSAPAKNPNDVTVGVEGGQKFRIVMAGDHTSFQIFHCGVSRATFTVGNADGTGVAYKTVALAKGEDNLWYANITFAEGVDTADYAVGVTKGDANYLYTELGVSGIKLNGTLVLSTVPEE